MNGNNNQQNDPVRDLVDDIIQKVPSEMVSIKNGEVYITVSRIHLIYQ